MFEVRFETTSSASAECIETTGARVNTTNNSDIFFDVVARLYALLCRSFKDRWWYFESTSID